MPWPCLGALCPHPSAHAFSRHYPANASMPHLHGLGVDYGGRSPPSGEEVSRPEQQEDAKTSTTRCTRSTFVIPAIALTFKFATAALVVAAPGLVILWLPSFLPWEKSWVVNLTQSSVPVVPDKIWQYEVTHLTAMLFGFLYFPVILLAYAETMSVHKHRRARCIVVVKTAVFALTTRLIYRSFVSSALWIFGVTATLLFVLLMVSFPLVRSIRARLSPSFFSAFLGAFFFWWVTIFCLSVVHAVAHRSYATLVLTLTIAVPILKELSLALIRFLC